MSTSDWIAGGALAISAGALVVSVISLKRQAKQQRLVELQIAELEEKAAEKAEERIKREVSEQFVRSFAGPPVKSSPRSSPACHPRNRTSCSVGPMN